ncbi:hypothetical protein ALC60_11408 [Trachymyrmex zeteki]|uniref:Nucleic-acid-binding protein from mobile element jockey n=1 Tax=Mycetomoellerius zeteki TaxID=64791 RepID=A0A151WNP3_9HYME|nr:hypothetical protein ALC60_11408 [Trachymyrmex zeteki]
MVGAGACSRGGALSLKHPHDDEPSAGESLPKAVPPASRSPAPDLPGERILYENGDLPPYIIFVRRVSGGDDGDVRLGSVAVARVMARIAGNEVIDVKSSGRNKVAISFKNLSTTNRALPRCARCGHDRHLNSKDCLRKQMPPLCCNCGGEYLPFSPKCSVYVRQKQIYAYTAIENVLYFEARSRFGMTSNPPPLLNSPILITIIITSFHFFPNPPISSLLSPISGP